MSTAVAAGPRPGRSGRRARGAAHGRLPLRLAVLAYLAVLLVIPVASVVWRGLSPGLDAAWQAITTPDAVHALVLTLEVAGIAVPLNTLFGMGAAILLARHRFPGSGVVSALVDLSLAVSPIVVGVALLLLYGRTGWLGPFLLRHGLRVVFSVPAIVLASAFVSLPYVVREVLPVLRELGTEQEQAASTLGAGPLATFWRITLPSVRWALAYGVTLTTARVLGEFGAVSVVSGSIAGQTETLTLFVNDQFNNFNQEGAYVGALVLCGISLAVLGLLGIIQSREKASPWLSPSNRSPSASAPPSLSTTSASR